MRRRDRGDLERAVLRVLWSTDAPVSAAEVRASFDDDERPALTTVLTVLDRLVTKDLVVRSGSARAQRFAAAGSESEAAASAMVRALTDSSDRSSALLQFAGELDEQDLDVLRRALRRARR